MAVGGMPRDEKPLLENEQDRYVKDIVATVLMRD
jgi:hypothetical protein